MMDGAKVRGHLQANQRLIDGETPGDSSLQESHTQMLLSPSCIRRIETPIQGCRSVTSGR